MHNSSATFSFHLKLMQIKNRNDDLIAAHGTGRHNSKKRLEPCHDTVHIITNSITFNYWKNDNSNLTCWCWSMSVLAKVNLFSMRLSDTNLSNRWKINKKDYNCLSSRMLYNVRHLAKRKIENTSETTRYHRPIASCWNVKSSFDNFDDDHMRTK